MQAKARGRSLFREGKLASARRVDCRGNRSHAMKISNHPKCNNPVHPVISSRKNRSLINRRASKRRQKARPEGVFTRLDVGNAFRNCLNSADGSKYKAASVLDSSCRGGLGLSTYTTR